MAIDALSPGALQQALFKKADGNKNGKLTGTEFAQALADVTGKPVSANDAAATLQQLDANKDGGIDIQEFQQANVSAANSLQSATQANLYDALSAGGVASSNTGSNIYNSLLNGSLGGTFTDSGRLVGQIVGGSVVKKLV